MRPFSVAPCQTLLVRFVSITGTEGWRRTRRRSAATLSVIQRGCTSGRPAASPYRHLGVDTYPGVTTIVCSTGAADTPARVRRAPQKREACSRFRVNEFEADGCPRVASRATPRPPPLQLSLHLAMAEPSVDESVPPRSLSLSTAPASAAAALPLPVGVRMSVNAGSLSSTLPPWEVMSAVNSFSCFCLAASVT
jgi:hypothetical protein